jgi:hypothetical protein
LLTRAILATWKVDIRRTEDRGKSLERPPSPKDGKQQNGLEILFK